MASLYDNLNPKYFDKNGYVIIYKVANMCQMGYWLVDENEPTEIISYDKIYHRYNVSKFSATTGFHKYRNKFFDEVDFKAEYEVPGKKYHAFYFIADALEYSKYTQKCNLQKNNMNNMLKNNDKENDIMKPDGTISFEDNTDKTEISSAENEMELPYSVEEVLSKLRVQTKRNDALDSKLISILTQMYNELLDKKIKTNEFETRSTEYGDTDFVFTMKIPFDVPCDRTKPLKEFTSDVSEMVFEQRHLNKLHSYLLARGAKSVDISSIVPKSPSLSRKYDWSLVVVYCMPSTK